jgi:hypothetical protein
VNFLVFLLGWIDVAPAVGHLLLMTPFLRHEGSHRYLPFAAEKDLLHSRKLALLGPALLGDQKDICLLSVSEITIFH